MHKPWTEKACVRLAVLIDFRMPLAACCPWPVVEGDGLAVHVFRTDTDEAAVEILAPDSAQCVLDTVTVIRHAGISFE
jgi:hypothetical protein